MSKPNKEPDGQHHRIETLTLTSLFPSSAQPRHGIFTEHRIKHLVGTGYVDTAVVAPVPWVPGFLRGNPRYGAYARSPHYERRQNIDVHYPRQLSIPRVGMPFAPFFYLLSAFRMVRSKPWREKIDVIDSYYIFPDGIAAVLLGRLLGKPVILTAYGTDINLIPTHLLPRKMIQWACRRADAITTVCAALRDALVDLGVDPKKIRVILHGVDLELFKPTGRRADLREKFGFKKRTLVSVGHLIERKGHHIVIEALESLPGCELVIIGDGEMESQLRRLTAEKGLEDRVRFLGHVPQNELPSYYEAADALVLASSREGIANVLVESMACGNPVVATDVWGASELITSRVCGRLAQERSPQSVAAAIEDLFAGYPDRTAVRRFAEGFNWEDTAEQHLAVLTDVLSPAGRAGESSYAMRGTAEKPSTGA